jgi:hypothetical protein
MSDIVERLREQIDPDHPNLWKVDKDRVEAADEIERLRGENEQQRKQWEDIWQRNVDLLAENEQLKVSLVRICGMAHNDRRVLEVRPRDEVMPGAFIAKLKRPR